ncbi:hypothetical protein SPRG_12840 [Saprolegnia parasitica CBS 223.65]|uniref:FAD/NAD(P)-binding domain-containing protein n=1 Tax=Saprolegnia parasitica (strain CBS 223.65) TaxID=695850 RepID=A0A067BTV2_SAPPC|nr:hypothetical protein SPRG_12840 [Saprolegnia parasitica CBS 223.65]KDO21974.1 hypothetical protein SPRG_12840 [Saprolegnia parasitica CBS 223.65]|eukprot:XP_012207315.1 hypothetical protein SPRG_12840 [Saprolegnia parasitica CBS 223.65]
MTTTVPEIVIVGGGYAGIQLAQALASSLPATIAHVTVIEQQSFSFHAIGAPRALVDKSFVPKLFMPLDKALPAHATLVRGIAESISATDVGVRLITEDGDELSTTTQSIRFDHLVLATGSGYPAPIKVANNVYNRSTIEASLLETYDRIAAASSVLIVGGGAVGCEIAGEIATTYPEKTVTLVDGNKELVSNAVVSDKFRTRLADGLTQRGVKLILGERLPERLTAHSYATTTITLSGGTQVTSDVQLVCAGGTLNTSLIAALDPSLVTPTGIKVTPAFQVDDPKYQNIYVLGDASNHPSPKMAYIAGAQAKFLAAGLVKKIKNGTPLPPFSAGSTQGLLIPIGRDGGVAQLPLFGGALPATGSCA